MPSHTVGGKWVKADILTFFPLQRIRFCWPFSKITIRNHFRAKISTIITNEHSLFPYFRIHHWLYSNSEQIIHSFKLSGLSSVSVASSNSTSNSCAIDEKDIKLGLRLGSEMASRRHTVWFVPGSRRYHTSSIQYLSVTSISPKW